MITATTEPGLVKRLGRLALGGRRPVEVSDSNCAAACQRLIHNWVIDVQRRGAKLCSLTRSKGTVNLSFRGRDRLRYSVQADFDSRLLRIELNRPEWKWVRRETLLLNEGSLRYLARRICPLSERQAVIPVGLLVRLSILCHDYRRLLDDDDREHHIHGSGDALRQIESELCQYLTPDEQQRSDDSNRETFPRNGQS
jgi:hypothetical protein